MAWRLMLAAACAAALWGCRGHEKKAAGADAAFAAAFDAKVAKVDRYMAGHTAANTPRAALRSALAAYGDGFAAAATDARGRDDAVAGRAAAAAESMRLYVESLDAAGDEARAMSLARAARAKWREAKRARPPAAAGPSNSYIRHY